MVPDLNLQNARIATPSAGPKPPFDRQLNSTKLPVCAGGSGHERGHRVAHAARASGSGMAFDVDPKAPQHTIERDALQSQSLTVNAVALGVEWSSRLCFQQVIETELDEHPDVAPDRPRPSTAITAAT